MRKRVIEMERKTVIGSRRINVISGEKRDGKQEQARPAREAKPIRPKQEYPGRETQSHEDGKN